MVTLPSVQSCRDSDSGPSTPRSMSTSAASSPLRFTSFSDQAGTRMRLSDDGQRRQWAGGRTSDTGSGEPDTFSALPVLARQACYLRRAARD